MSLKFNPVTGELDLVNPSSSGGGAVDSVNGYTGVVELVSSDLSDFQETVEDIIGTKVIAGTNVSVSYNDATGETTISSTASGGASVTQTTIDFGSAGKTDEVFNIVDVGVSPTSKITAFVAWVSTLGRDADEVMADPISISVEPLAGSMNVYAMALEGTVSGKYAINYQVA